MADEEDEDEITPEDTAEESTLQLFEAMKAMVNEQAKDAKTGKIDPHLRYNFMCEKITLAITRLIYLKNDYDAEIDKEIRKLEKEEKRASKGKPKIGDVPLQPFVASSNTYKHVINQEYNKMYR